MSTTMAPGDACRKDGEVVEAKPKVAEPEPVEQGAERREAAEADAGEQEDAMIGDGDNRRRGHTAVNPTEIQSIAPRLRTGA